METVKDSYFNHLDHLQDLIRLTNLKMAAIEEGYSEESRQKILEFQKFIAEKQENAHCFLPMVHVSGSLGLGQLERNLLQTLAAVACDPSFSETALDAHFLFQLEQPFFEGIRTINSLQPEFLRFVICQSGRELNPNLSLNPRLLQFITTPNIHSQDRSYDLYLPGSFSPCQEPVSSKILSIREVILRHYAIPALEPCFIWLYGPDGCGKRTLVKALSNDLDFPVLFVDGSNLLTSGVQKENGLEKAMLESILTDAPICFFNCEHFTEISPAGFSDFTKEIRIISRLCFFTSVKDPIGIMDGSIPILPVEILLPGQEEKISLFQHLLQDQAVSFPNDEAALILSPFHLSLSQVKNVVSLSKLSAAAKGRDEIAAEDLRSALKRSCSKVLKSQGKLVESIHSWDDLILPETQKSALKEAADRVLMEYKVFILWGYGKKQKNRGTALLFTGPPGTGKTMAAGIFSKELGLPMYQVDLATIMSKYIGETEKNLKGIFDEAMNSNCVLFFDEADAIFGKRTEVKDSHDKYANLDVSYLLQRLDQHSGVTILATNFQQNLDDAFRRRLHYIVEFSLPDAALRKELWQKSIPAEAPQDCSMDFDLLSHYSLSPSTISTVSLSAAYLAAAESDQISMKHMVRALSLENEKGSLGLDLSQLYFYL